MVIDQGRLLLNVILPPNFACAAKSRKMAAPFNSMDWVDEENDLSAVIDSGTRIASGKVLYS